jgi:chemotaxis protein MotA
MAEGGAAPTKPHRKFDVGAPIGIVGGLSLLVFAFILEGGSPASLWGLSSFLIVFGGTVMTLTITFPVPTLLKFPKFINKAFFSEDEDQVELIRTLVRLADKARRQSLLSLEDEIQRLPNDFLREGIQEVVDGTPAEQIKELLEIRIDEMEGRHEEGITFFEQGGGFAPTMGIIGTVMGLVVTLSKLADADVGALGHAISVAFIATLYGIGTSNLFWLPLSQRLRKRSEHERAVLRMMLEGILGVQAGDPPRIVKAKLAGFLSAAQRARLDTASPAAQAEGAAGAMQTQPAT